MKKTIFILILLLVFASCKDEVVEEPDRLIAKEEMVNIMYDLSLLEAMKYQNLPSSEVYKMDPSEYIYQKYKIDSLQFVQSNKYYASNYKEYKEMFDQINKRLEQDKARVDLLIKVENKKKKKVIPIKTPLPASATKIDSLKKKPINLTKTTLPASATEIDSIKKKPLTSEKFINSKWPLYTDEYLKIPFLKRF